MAKITLVKAETGQEFNVDSQSISRVEVFSAGVLKIYIGAKKFHLVKNSQELLPLVKATVQGTLFDYEPFVDLAAKGKEEGMKQAIDHANEVDENWSEKAEEVFMMYLSKISNNHEFMAEDVREFAEENKLIPEPPHKRAWGGITYKLAKRGDIIKVGAKATRNPRSHQSYATVWIKKPG